MARRGAARRLSAAESHAEAVAGVTDETVHACADAQPAGSPVDLNRIIHERVRLAMVSALAGSESLSFNELKELLGTTDGNLSVHARRLEDAGYITCEKSFAGRTPRTEYRITADGREALNRYLDHMEALIRRVREE